MLVIHWHPPLSSSSPTPHYHQKRPSPLIFPLSLFSQALFPCPADFPNSSAGRERKNSLTTFPHCLSLNYYVWEFCERRRHANAFLVNWTPLCEQLPWVFCGFSRSSCSHDRIRWEFRSQSSGWFACPDHLLPASCSVILFWLFVRKAVGMRRASDQIRSCAQSSDPFRWWQDSCLYQSVPERKKEQRIFWWLRLNRVSRRVSFTLCAQWWATKYRSSVKSSLKLSGNDIDTESCLTLDT